MIVRCIYMSISTIYDVVDVIYVSMIFYDLLYSIILDVI